MQATDIAEDVQGDVAPGFENVVEEFRRGIQNPSNSGAALSIWHQGLEVVSIWCGMADTRTRRPWASDTLNVLFSGSKGLSTLVLALLEEAGRLDLNQPIADVWPEFAAHGKGTVSTGDVLAHRAGVSAPMEDLPLDTVLDSRGMAERIAGQKPLWEPGTGHAYHAITWGMIAEEIVRRVTGRELYALFAEEIAAPLKADVTLKAEPEDPARVSYLTTSDAWAAMSLPQTPAGTWAERALTLGGAFPLPLVRGDEGLNDPRVQKAGMAGVGGLGTASGLGRIWSSTVAPTLGTRILKNETVQALRQPRSEGPWVFDLGLPTHRWGIGVQLSSEVTPWLSKDSFGHDGAGGMCGMADPNYQVGLGYVRNRMDSVDAVAPIINALRPIIS